jgi:hypothetical protein
MTIGRTFDDYDIIKSASLLPWDVGIEQMPCEDEERLQRIHRQATEELI